MAGRRRGSTGDPPPAGTARSAAIGLLGRRDYTRHELRTRLIDRGYAPGEVDEVIARLADERWLDDTRVARAHARTSAQIKSRGRRRIERELAARGVDAATVRGVLADLNPDDEIDAVRRFVARKHLPRPVAPDQRRKLFQQLLRRGFSGAVISKVLGGKDEEME
jgi:regulatory protein